MVSAPFEQWAKQSEGLVARKNRDRAQAIEAPIEHKNSETAIGALAPLLIPFSEHGACQFGEDFVDPLARLGTCANDLPSPPGKFTLFFRVYHPLLG